MVDKRGPDLVIAGAARSGTSLLAAHLGEHPRIDPGAVKETNFYSRKFDEGYAWYDEYFEDAPGTLRMDASVSYTYPQYPEALERLAADDPRLVVYVAREPIRRTVSHYQLYRYYFESDEAPTFGAALERSSYYREVSNYEHWLDQLVSRFGVERVLVVPFPLVTGATDEVAAVICDRLGLDAPPPIGDEVRSHQNNVVKFRSDTVRKVTARLRKSRLYPIVRKRLGAHVVRRIRGSLTTTPQMPSTEESLATCAPADLEQLYDVARRGERAVATYLAEQDARLGLGWSSHWTVSEA